MLDEQSCCSDYAVPKTETLQSRARNLWERPRSHNVRTTSLTRILILTKTREERASESSHSHRPNDVFDKNSYSYKAEAYTKITMDLW